MLVSGKLSKEMKAFIKMANKMTQKDANKAIDEFCNNHEKNIYDAIKSIKITIPPGLIIVSGSPATQTNAAPIVLTNVIS
jgi:hypothetical protein